MHETFFFYFGIANNFLCAKCQLKRNAFGLKCDALEGCRFHFLLIALQIVTEGEKKVKSSQYIMPQESVSLRSVAPLNIVLLVFARFYGLSVVIERAHI